MLLQFVKPVRKIRLGELPLFELWYSMRIAVQGLFVIKDRNRNNDQHLITISTPFGNCEVHFFK